MSVWSILTNHDIIIPWHSIMFHRNYLLVLFGDVCTRHIYSLYKPTCILYIPQFNLYLHCLTTTTLHSYNLQPATSDLYKGTLASFHSVLSLCRFTFASSSCPPQWLIVITEVSICCTIHSLFSYWCHQQNCTNLGCHGIVLWYLHVLTNNHQSAIIHVFSCTTMAHWYQSCISLASVWHGSISLVLACKGMSFWYKSAIDLYTIDQLELCMHKLQLCNIM